MILPRSFYTRTDVVLIARELLGKILVTETDGEHTAAMITETEAYAGVSDRASHAFGERRTPRTEVMFREGGVAYVYLCYGMHHLFNVVTNKRGSPHAVLVRAVQPLEGIDVMLRRRSKTALTPSLTSGPGALSVAMGIHTRHTGRSLLSEGFHIEDRGIAIGPEQIIAATRVGVAYAREDALLPYRFFVKGSSYVSRGKGV